METNNLITIITYWMQGEITTFIRVWISAYLALIYCYFAAKLLPTGAARLAAFSPVVCLFLLLPLDLHSVHLSAITSFFLSWLAIFKLLMLVFNNGPLSNPSISLLKFVAVACLPIKLRSETLNSKSNQKGHKPFWNYASKAVLIALLLKTYDYSDKLNNTVLLVLYGFNMYFILEIILAVAGAVARGLIGAELEPQFDEPYMSASLQDFWGRRWNLMATRVLRPTVYLPVLDRSANMVGRKWAPVPAVVSTFVVSGLIHELMFYHLGRMRPTLEVTYFFCLHGACLAVEVFVKKAVNGRCRLPRVVGSVWTVGFVMVTGLWLFFPPLMRCNAMERGLAEYAAVGAFVNDVVGVLRSTL